MPSVRADLTILVIQIDSSLPTGSPTAHVISRRPIGCAQDVLVRRENGVLIVTINRPQQRNAVNGAVSAGIARALDLLDSSSELRVGVLHGAGTAFCAGMDLNAFADGEQVQRSRAGFRRPRRAAARRSR